MFKNDEYECVLTQKYNAKQHTYTYTQKDEISTSPSWPAQQQAYEHESQDAFES